jgi:hypothetical protein
VDNIKIDLGEIVWDGMVWTGSIWLRIGTRDQWRALVNKVIKLRFP